jgi:hypothetical protein
VSNTPGDTHNARHLIALLEADSVSITAIL